VRIAVLCDPVWPVIEPFLSDVRSAASALGKRIEILYASTGRDIDTVIADHAQQQLDALLGGPSALTNNRRVQLVTLAAHPRRKEVCPGILIPGALRTGRCGSRLKAAVRHQAIEYIQELQWVRHGSSPNHSCVGIKLGTHFHVSENSDSICLTIKRSAGLRN
jgi:hypothetical protein